MPRCCGEIGRRKGLKIPRWQHRTGSSPVSGTKPVVNKMLTAGFLLSKQAVHAKAIFLFYLCIVKKVDCFRAIDFLIMHDTSLFALLV